jgi:hypothetical protein
LSSLYLAWIVIFVLLFDPAAVCLVCSRRGYSNGHTSSSSVTQTSLLVVTHEQNEILRNNIEQ